MDEPAGQREQEAPSRGMVIGPGEGRTIPGTNAITLIATAEQTGGSIGVFEDTTSPGDGPPRHVHHGSDEDGPCLQGHRHQAGKDAFGFHPRGTGAGLRGVRQVAHRGRRGESERAPKQECGADERDVRGAKRELRLRVRGTTPVGLWTSRSSLNSPSRHFGE
jgi:hypothetical protein